MNFISHNHESSQFKGKSEILGWQSRQVWRDGKCLLINEFFKFAFLLQIWWGFFSWPNSMWDHKGAPSRDQIHSSYSESAVLTTGWPGKSC